MAFWTSDFWEDDVAGIFKEAGRGIESGWGDFSSGAEDFLKGVGAFFEDDVLDFIKSVGGVISDDIFPFLKDIGTGLFDTVKGLGGALKDTITGAWNRLQKFWKIGDNLLDSLDNPLFWIALLVGGFLVLENVIPILIHR